MRMIELRRALNQWRDRLGLANFKIELAQGRALPPGQEPEPFSKDLAHDCSGHTWWQAEYPEVLIVVRRGEDEATIVHELLHLRLEGHLTRPRKYDPLYERALNELADALVKAREGAG